MSKEVIEALRKQAGEIAKEGHFGWGNTMTAAADALDTLLAERDAAQKDAERYRRMRAVVIAEREGCTEELYDNECDRLLEAYDAALQGEQP